MKVSADFKMKVSADFMGGAIIGGGAILMGYLFSVV